MQFLNNSNPIVTEVEFCPGLCDWLSLGGGRDYVGSLQLPSSYFSIMLRIFFFDFFCATHQWSHKSVGTNHFAQK